MALVQFRLLAQLIFHVQQARLIVVIVSWLLVLLLRTMRRGSLLGLFRQLLMRVLRLRMLMGSLLVFSMLGRLVSYRGRWIRMVMVLLIRVLLLVRLLIRLLRRLLVLRLMALPKMGLFLWRRRSARTLWQRCLKVLAVVRQA